jgi:hypothetical protein
MVHFHKDVFKYRRCSLPVELLQLPEVGEIILGMAAQQASQQHSLQRSTC